MVDAFNVEILATFVVRVDPRREETRLELIDPLIAVNVDTVRFVVEREDRGNADKTSELTLGVESRTPIVAVEIVVVDVVNELVVTVENVPLIRPMELPVILEVVSDDIDIASITAVDVVSEEIVATLGVRVDATRDDTRSVLRAAFVPAIEPKPSTFVEIEDAVIDDSWRLLATNVLVPKVQVFNEERLTTIVKKEEPTMEESESELSMSVEACKDEPPNILVFPVETLRDDTCIVLVRIELIRRVEPPTVDICPRLVVMVDPVTEDVIMELICGELAVNVHIITCGQVVVDAVREDTCRELMTWLNELIVDVSNEETNRRSDTNVEWIALDTVMNRCWVVETIEELAREVLATMVEAFNDDKSPVLIAIELSTIDETRNVE